MDDKIREMLNDEIETHLVEMEARRPGEKEHAEIVKSLETLYQLRIEEMRIEKEYEEKEARRIMEGDQFDCNTIDADRESALKKRQFFNDRIVGYIGLGVTVLGILAPIAFNNVWMNKGLKFEEEGSFTSPVFRGLWSKFRPTK